jgi:hypothetical protein
MRFHGSKDIVWNRLETKKKQVVGISVKRKILEVYSYQKVFMLRQTLGGGRGHRGRWGLFCNHEAILLLKAKAKKKHGKSQK